MKLCHIALRVDDLEAAGEFYEKVLGFTDVRGGHNRDHFSRHMTDGQIDLAIMKYDKGASSAESKEGEGRPCIHHIGFGVDNFDEWKTKIDEMGLEVLSKPGVIPIKFRAPGGQILEIAPAEHFDVSTPR